MVSSCQKRSATPRQKLRLLIWMIIFIFIILTFITIILQDRLDLTIFPATSLMRANLTTGDLEPTDSGLPSSKDETVTILMWTGWYVDTFQDGPIEECSNLKCEFTRNRSLINSSNAVVFHIRQLNWDDLPVNRMEWQYYVYYSLESPTHSSVNYLADWKREYFNLTMSYRLDSDAYAPYGRVINRRSPLRRDLRDLMNKKTLPAAWLVSNCNAPSKREVLVQKLNESFQIDIYGKCGSNECKRDTDHWHADPESCGSVFEEKYKFYLSFENSLCRDYVTEKLYSRLRSYTVPIVLERKNYAHLCPEYEKPWFIAADDFGSVQELASYIQYLISNDTAYYEYLMWHNYYETEVIINSDTRVVARDHWCNLCRLVARKELRPGWNVFEWWHNGTCHWGEY